MKRDHFLQRKNKDMRLLSEKEEKVAFIKKYFSSFGERVLNTMLNHATSDTGLNNLMRKLGILRKDKDEDTIFAEIVGWIYTYGEPRFLSLYKELIPKELSSQKVEPVESLSTQTSQTALSPDESSPGSPLDSTVTVEIGSTSGDVSPVLSPAIESKPSREAEKKWPEVERRSGKDRRARKERRKDMDVVFKNKRFGGERRSVKDRRKNWKSTKLLKRNFK
ncbi:MAG: hypothetical protein NT106_06980 [Candidatus Sumerlaeota bacterium]|nr:hypothetical protein [Candidatus Sumerlaeota bacterium]